MKIKIQHKKELSLKIPQILDNSIVQPFNSIECPRLHRIPLTLKPHFRYLQFSSDRIQTSLKKYTFAILKLKSRPHNQINVLNFLRLCSYQEPRAAVENSCCFRKSVTLFSEFYHILYTWLKVL